MARKGIPELKSLVAKFGSIRVAVVGDLILDVYLWGGATRLSQEAPVPVLQVARRTERLGGAANVMCNIVTLGAKALAFGVTGADANAARLKQIMEEYGIDHASVIDDPSRITTEKQRVIAGSQQLLRIDHEIEQDISPKTSAAIVKNIKTRIAKKEIDAVILEDYAKGTLGQKMAGDISKAAMDAGLLVGLDPHPAHPLQVSNITLMTPNKAEAYGLAGIYQTPLKSEREENKRLEQVAEKIRDKWNPEYLLITLGAKGMALFERGKSSVVIPTRAREVFDVSGAGDTVIAAFSLAILAGACGREAADIANHAAGVVVGKIGTAHVSREELLESF